MSITEVSKKIPKHNVLTDAASYIVVFAAATYFFGLAYYYGLAVGLNVPSSMITYDVYGYIAGGFTNILIVFLSVLIFLIIIIAVLVLASIFFEKNILKVYEEHKTLKAFKKYKKYMIISTLLILFLSQVKISLYVGQKLSEDMLNEIEQHSKGTNKELKSTKEVVINYLTFEKKNKDICGYALISSNEYEIIADTDGIHALPKSRILKITFPKNINEKKTCDKDDKAK